jgi:3-deoxy-D-manno-octulosonic-acid transferase/heptosyltransferase-1
LEKTRLDSILIVKLSAIGDVVHTLPLLEVLRNNYPHARIDWVVEEDASQIIAGHQEIDHLFISPRKSWQRRFFKSGEKRAVIKELRAFIQELRACEYDLIIDLHGLFKSGLLTGLARGKRKIGFSFGTEGSSLFLTEEPHSVEMEQHALDRYMETVDILRCQRDTWRGDIPLSRTDRESVDHLIREKGLEKETLLAINPMAKWETKLWENENFAKLADRLQRELCCKVIFTGSEADRTTLDDITQQMNERPLNLAGQINLKELAYLYTKCHLLVTTDTGPMHIAAAMKCPVVALFGPTAPLRTGPYGEGHTVLREPMACSPCFKKTCPHRNCMTGITVERVFDAVKKTLGGEEEKVM